MPQSIAVDRALLGHDDQRRRDVARSILTTAQQQAQPWSRWRTVPGIGALLRLGLLDALQASTRFPRVQDVLASCRLVTGTQEAAGRR